MDDGIIMIELIIICNWFLSVSVGGIGLKPLQIVMPIVGKAQQTVKS